MPEALGFSADGLRFAFGEWGQQDGSGFVYGSVYFLDLGRDAWTAQPVRVLIREETVAPGVAWQEAQRNAGVALAAAEIAWPAQLVFARTAPGARADRATFGWTSFTPDVIAAHEAVVSLASFEIAGTDCGDPPLGFALEIDGREVHRDARLPGSRGCPSGYSLERVYLPHHVGDPAFAVALIGVYRWAFEGEDLRHIAVPVPLK